MIVLFQNDDGAGEFPALAIRLVADVVPQPDPPNFAFAKIEPLSFVRGVGRFFDFVPAVEVFLQTQVCRA